MVSPPLALSKFLNGVVNALFRHDRGEALGGAVAWESRAMRWPMVCAMVIALCFAFVALFLLTASVIERLRVADSMLGCLGSLLTYGVSAAGYVLGFWLVLDQVPAQFVRARFRWDDGSEGHLTVRMGIMAGLPWLPEPWRTHDGAIAFVLPNDIYNTVVLVRPSPCEDGKLSALELRFAWSGASVEAHSPSDYSQVRIPGGLTVVWRDGYYRLGAPVARGVNTLGGKP